MRKLIIVLFLLLPTAAMAQSKMASDSNFKWTPAPKSAIVFDGESTYWYAKPSPNMCRGVAPGGVLLWADCPLAWQKEIVKQGRSKDVSPGSMVFKQGAQEVVTAKNEGQKFKPSPNAPSSLVVPNDGLTTPKIEEKPKPVIIPNAKRQEWAIISLQLENAKLKAEAAVPAEIKKAVKDANDALDAFWKGIGVNPAELTTKWDVSDGQNGDIILTPKVEKKVEPPAKTP